MSEYIGYKDPIGNGLFNMGLTDEEIVRCKDCKKRRLRLEFGKYWCKHLYRYVYPDGFCAWAEKRCDG